MHFFIVATTILLFFPLPAAQNPAASQAQERIWPSTADFQVPEKFFFKLDLNKRMRHEKCTYKKALQDYHNWGLPLIIAVSESFKCNSGFYAHDQLCWWKKSLSKATLKIQTETRKKKRKDLKITIECAEHELKKLQKNYWFLVSADNAFDVAGQSTIKSYFIGRGTDRFNDLISLAKDTINPGNSLPPLTKRLYFYLNLAEKYGYNQASNTIDANQAFLFFNICLHECSRHPLNDVKIQAATAFRRSARIHDHLCQTASLEHFYAHLQNAKMCFAKAIRRGDRKSVYECDGLLKKYLPSESYLVERQRLQQMVNTTFRSPQAFDTIIAQKTQS